MHLEEQSHYFLHFLASKHGLGPRLSRIRWRGEVTQMLDLHLRPTPQMFTDILEGCEAAGDSDQALDFLRRMELVGYVPTVRPAGPTPVSAILAVVVLRL